MQKREMVTVLGLAGLIMWASCEPASKKLAPPDVVRHGDRILEINLQTGDLVDRPVAN